MIANRLAMVTIVVPDYEAGLAFFVGKLGFACVEDTPLDSQKRWVVVSPGSGTHLLLARAANDDQAAAIGRQAGGRVGFFLNTDDIAQSLRCWSGPGWRLIARCAANPMALWWFSATPSAIFGI